jgi:hypothetical protein
MRDEEMLQEIEDFIEGFNQPTYRGNADQRGPGGDMVEPARLEWPMSGGLSACPRELMASLPSAARGRPKAAGCLAG